MSEDLLTNKTNTRHRANHAAYRKKRNLENN